MACVEDPIQLTTAPSGKDFDSDVQPGRHSTKRIDRQRSDVPAFDERHLGAGNAGLVGDVLLTPLFSDSHGPKRGADALVKHGCDGGEPGSSPAHPRLTRQFATGARLPGFLCS